MAFKVQQVNLPQGDFINPRVTHETVHHYRLLGDLTWRSRCNPAKRNEPRDIADTGISCSQGKWDDDSA